MAQIFHMKQHPPVINIFKKRENFAELLLRDRLSSRGITHENSVNMGLLRVMEVMLVTVHKSHWCIFPWKTGTSYEVAIDFCVAQQSLTWCITTDSCANLLII